MKSKHILCLLLCTAMLCACGGNEPQETADTTDVNTDTVQPEETETPVYDGLEDRDFSTSYGDSDFRIITNSAGNYDNLSFQFIAEEQTGDLCNDAVYNRNLAIQERFHVKINCQEINVVEAVRNAVTAGINEYDLAVYPNSDCDHSIIEGHMLNWYDIPVVNMEQPWHNHEYIENFTINGKLYTMCSDLSLNAMTYTYAMFVNTSQLERKNHNFTELYNMVKKGTWTVDNLFALTESYYEDLNGNGKWDEEDFYGLGYNFGNNAGDVWMAAFDQQFVKVVNGKEIEVTFMSEKTSAIVDKLLHYHYSTPVLYVQKTDSTVYPEQDAFAQGTVVFAPLRFHAAYYSLRDMSDEYAMLPFPKWNEEQTAYHTNMDDKFSVFAVPITVYEKDQLEMIGTIYEALCAENHRSVYPAYYDTALKGRYSASTEVAEMVDLILENRYIDISFQWPDIFQGIPHICAPDCQLTQTTLHPGTNPSNPACTQASKQNCSRCTA